MSCLHLKPLIVLMYSIYGNKKNDKLEFNNFGARMSAMSDFN